ncbi:MAG: tyrosine-protein phosphatase [Treponema sp.]|nr:tyrosine-protein phosphatase [Treponema sp.]
MNRFFPVALLCALVALVGCYNEIVPQHPSERPDALLPIAGAANMRDIGGYVGAGGRVRYGLLIRSGEMSTLSVRDRNLLSGMGVRYVVDFRSGDSQIVFGDGDDYLEVAGFASERRHAPTRLWEGAYVWDSGTNAVGVPSLDRNTSIPENTIVPDHEAIIRAAPGDPLSTLAGVINHVTNTYGLLVTQGNVDGTPVQRAQYMSFFRAVLASIEAETPMLFHCSAGKDRAGVATALLLLALGVSETDIVANYMISEPIVYERFFPVVPMIRRSVALDMREQRGEAQTFAGAMAFGPPASVMAEAGMREGMRRRVLQGTMQGIFGGIMRVPGMTEDMAADQARQQVDAIAAALGSDTPTGEPVFDGTVQMVRDNIEGAFQMAKAGMLELAGMTDAEIDAVARDGSARIAPLLSVYEEWITAALTEVRDVWGNGDINAGIESFLDGVDPALSGAQVIGRLKTFYLE